MTPLKKNGCEYVYILRDPGSPCQMMIRVSGVQSVFLYLEPVNVLYF